MFAKVISTIPIIQKVIDFLLPPQCALCHEIVQKSYSLCASCWSHLTFITSPKCSTCSVPLENVDHDMVCADCLKNPPIFSKAYAPLVYNASIKKLILQYKNHDALHLGPLFLQWLQDFVPKNIDMIIPVPLHWWRFFIRQYNQAEEMGKHLEKSMKIPMCTRILKRTLATSRQAHKSRELRYENLKEAFTIKNSQNILKKANVLLVDDVLTSGATANACANVLLEAGAEKVEVLTIARAIKGRDGAN